jgi:dihydroflavonol-4-reductase
VKVFVTGGNGFVGSAVVRALRARDHEVVAIVRPTADRASLEGLDGVTIRVGTLDDPKALVPEMNGCEGLCHVAGAAGKFYTDRDEYTRSNVAMSESVFAAAHEAGIRRAVYTGSVVVARGLDNAYAASKRAGAEAARRVAPSTDVRVVHPSGMIGPRDRKPTPLGRAIQQFLFGELRTAAGGASGYVHVDDAGAAHAAALEASGDSETSGAEYLIDAHWWSTEALFGALAEIVGRRPPRVIPIDLAHAIARVAEPVWRSLGGTPPVSTFVTSYLRMRKSSDGRAEADRHALGLPEYASVPQMLEDAVRWFGAPEAGLAAERVGPGAAAI